MFNRSAFDRSAFDRSTSQANVEALWRGTGEINIGLVVNTTINPWEFSGKGNLSVGLILEQHVPLKFSGEGNLISSQELILRLRLPCVFDGEGDLDPIVNVMVPTSKINLGGLGGLNNPYLNFKLMAEANIGGKGDLTTQLSLLTSLEGSLSGQGDFKNSAIRLPINISTSLSGEGNVVLSRLGALNTDTLEFTGLNLRPGETLTIDTDELLVFLNAIEDVSSVTSDSVFFQLQPGENEISFVTNGTPNLDVLIIYNNRWL